MIAPLPGGQSQGPDTEHGGSAKYETCARRHWGVSGLSPGATLMLFYL